MNYYCELCSINFQFEDEYENHLKNENHLFEEKKFETTDLNEMKDSDIYCVFCSQFFDTIEKVEQHIAEEHTGNEQLPEKPETNDFLLNNSSSEIKSEILIPFEKSQPIFSNFPENKIIPNNNLILSNKLTVYDVDLNVVHVDGTKLDQIKFCVRCNRHFDGEDNFRQHQLKDHAIRKRKRSSHPNGVEGIVVTGDGRWSCDVCGREFPTLKQAKVHKFKSHIEPVQKQEMLSHDFMIRNNPPKETGNVTETITTGNHYYNNNNIQSNNNNENVHILPRQISPVQEININQISPKSDVNNQQIINESESETQSHVIDLSQSSSPTNANNPDCETVWKIKSLDPEDTKISLSKIQLKIENKKNVTKSTEPFSLSARNYMCSHCSMYFGSRAVYSRHILVHRRGKAFGCENCGMAFTRNHTLKQHKDMKCVISNPVVGVNCEANNQCVKCGTYFASSNSHLSHCKKICKITVANAADEDSSKDSVKSEETNAQCESQLEIDLGENDNFSPIIINDFINNPAFVTKRINEFNCNLCCCYFASYKSIGHHLENYHRIEIRSGTNKKFNETENPNVIQDFIHKCDECESKYGSKEALLKHKQQSHAPKQTEFIPNKMNNIIESYNRFSMDKPIKIEPHCSPPRKILNPNNFSLPNLVPMFSPEALNLSTTQSVTLNTNSVPQMSSVMYKSPSVKKSKVPPNANGEFECTECHKAFGCRSSLSNHIKSHFNLRNKPFPCEDCKQGFMSQISYQEHRKSQCPKLYGINVSDNSIATNFSSPNMSYTLTGSSPSSASSRATCCMHCNAAFPDRSLLEDHAAKEHSNESGEIMCMKCTRSFTTYMAFRVHTTKTHGGPNGSRLKSSQITKTPPQSPISSFTESPFSSFHLSTFSSLSRHTCQSCKKDFGTAQALGNHKRVCESPIFTETNVSKDQLII